MKGMKTKYLLWPLLCITAVLSSCVVSPYGYGYYGPYGYGPYGYGPYGYGPYGPYGYGYYGPYGYGGFYGDTFFLFWGVTYYNYHGRYCYYEHGHRVFISHLPSGGHYIHGGAGYHGPMGGTVPHSQANFSMQGQHYVGGAGAVGMQHGVTTGTSHVSSGMGGGSREHR